VTTTRHQAGRYLELLSILTLAGKIVPMADKYDVIMYLNFVFMSKPVANPFLQS